MTGHTTGDWLITLFACVFWPLLVGGGTWGLGYLWFWMTK